MTADRTIRPADTTARPTAAVLRGVTREQRRPLVLWSIAVAAVTAMYVGFYPAMGEGNDLDAFIENMPEGLVQALGYDQIGTAGGYLTSTIYGLLGPALLLVFAIAAGARLIAGLEEDGTLELELTHPVARRTIYVERLLALWANVFVLVGVLTLVVLAMVAALDMEVGVVEILAGGTGLLLLVVGIGSLAFAVGAATGRRSVGLAVGSAVAVLSFLADAIGAAVDGMPWATTVSPWSWYLAENPLIDGFDPVGLLQLAALTLVAATVGLVRFDRRDLGV